MLKPLANTIIRYVANSSPWLRGLAKRIFKSKWLLQNHYYQNYVLREAARIDDTAALPVNLDCALCLL